MPTPLPKDWMTIAIDFVIGGLAGDVMVALGIYKFMGWHGRIPDWSLRSFGISMLATTLIAGSLCAVFRNEIWAGVDTYSIVPRAEERLSRKGKIVLWILFASGCASLGLFLVP